MPPTAKPRAARPEIDADLPLDATAPPPRAPTPEARIDAYRARIDALNRALVELLVERTGLCVDLGRVKEALGLPVRVPAREEIVLDQVRRAARGPLDADAAARIFRAIIDETCKVQARTRRPRAPARTGGSSRGRLAGAPR